MADNSRMKQNNSQLQTVILIPTYQPSQVLIKIVDQLRQANFEVVVVDDGSGPDYAPIFQKLDSAVHLIHHNINRGKGAVLKTGYHYIKNHFKYFMIITVDGDGQHSFDDIKNLAKNYTYFRGKLMLGVRTFDKRNVPARSLMGNLLTRKVLQLITRQHISDTQTGLRAFDHSLVDEMLAISGDRYEYETNVLLYCVRQQIEIVEIPIATIYENNNAASHFDTVRDSWKIYKEIIKFASSSIISFLIDYVLFIILYRLTNSWGLALSVSFANIVARIISASVNFNINKRLVFQHQGETSRSALNYATLVLVIMFANLILLNLLTSGLGVAAQLAKIITELMLFAISYFVQKKLIFTNKTKEVKI